MRVGKIIMLIDWFLIGLLFLISPLPITKHAFGMCWLSLMIFIIMNLIEKRGTR